MCIECCRVENFILHTLTHRAKFFSECMHASAAEMREIQSGRAVIRIPCRWSGSNLKLHFTGSIWERVVVVISLACQTSPEAYSSSRYFRGRQPARETSRKMRERHAGRRLVSPSLRPNWHLNPPQSPIAQQQLGKRRTQTCHVLKQVLILMSEAGKIPSLSLLIYTCR